MLVDVYVCLRSKQPRVQSIYLVFIVLIAKVQLLNGSNPELEGLQVWAYGPCCLQHAMPILVVGRGLTLLANHRSSQRDVGTPHELKS